MPGRIKYIDALRGLAMLMVVMVHVEGFSVFIEEFHVSFFRRICEALMLPLFFFISGFLARPISGKALMIKCTQLLVPSIILPRDGGAWWAAVYGVAQSRTRLK